MSRGGVQELAPVGAAVQTLVANAALRRSGNHHAVALLHPLDERTDLFDNAHSGMVGNRRLGGIRGAQRASDDGVADCGRLRANQDFARLDRVQPKFLNRRARAVPHKSLEAPPGIGSGKLCGSLSRYNLRDERQTAGRCRRSARKHLPSRNRHLRSPRYARIPRTSGIANVRPKNVGKDETIALDDLASLHINGPVEDGRIVDKGVELAVFSTRIDLRRKAFDQFAIEIAACEGLVEFEGIHAGDLRFYAGCDHFPSERVVEISTPETAARDRCLPVDVRGRPGFPPETNRQMPPPGYLQLQRVGTQCA